MPMSINRDMRPYRLEVNHAGQTASGAAKDHWSDAGMVMAAVYQAEQAIRYGGSETYKETTHIGLTFERQVKAKISRLTRDGVKYLVLASAPQGRMAQLALKVVEDG